MKPNSDVLLKIDKEIDAALKVFREIQPPATMQSRIHRNLENAVESSGQTSRGWLLWVPATCAAMGVIMFAIYFQTHWVRKKPSPKIETAKMVADSVSPKFTNSRPEFSHEPKMSMPEIHHRREHSRYHRAVNLLSYPLTNQEKLLIRFAQTAKAEDLRDLNPEYQAKVEAQQEAEFAAYLKSGSSSNKRNAEDTNQSIHE